MGPPIGRGPWARAHSSPMVSPALVAALIETLHYSTFFFYQYLAPFPSLPPSPFLTGPVITGELTGESAATHISCEINLGQECFEISLCSRGMSTWRADHSHFQYHVTHFTCAKRLLWQHSTWLWKWQMVWSFPASKSLCFCLHHSRLLV